MLFEMLLDSRATRHSFDQCKEISPECPVEATVLGYYPNFGASVFFALAFGLCLIASVGLGIKTRTWTYSAAIWIGLILETAGYVGRALLNKNPWNSGAFQLQICAIILAPTFICVSVYLTLKHVALNLNPDISRIRPKWYPIIFLPADLSCLIVQAIGGGIAAAAGKTNKKLLDGGNQAIIAGIALQVVVLGGFGIMGLDYYIRVRKYMHSPEANGAALALWREAKFRKFGFAVMGAYITILVRCVYRIIEMAGGWGNHIMQDQVSFIVLDSTLVLVAVFLLTAFHPGILFPQMRNGSAREETTEKTMATNEAANETSGASSNDGVKPEEA